MVSACSVEGTSVLLRLLKFLLCYFCFALKLAVYVIIMEIHYWLVSSRWCCTVFRETFSSLALHEEGWMPVF